MKYVQTFEKYNQINEHNEYIWSDIRTDFEDNGIIHVDAWVHSDDDEEGKVIATINTETKEVDYKDERAKTDIYAQEMIDEVLDGL